MKKSNLIFLIIGGLILLGLGYGYGYLSGQKTVEETENPLTTLLSSKVIDELDAIASGEITAISERNLTLTKEGESWSILIKEGVAIERFVAPAGGTTADREEIGLADLQIGDQVNVVCQLTTEGSWVGINVIVLP